MNSQINDIYNNVDNKLDQQDSIIFNSNTEFGEFDIETLTVPVTFIVEPKQIYEETEVYLKVDDEIIILEKDMSTFMATHTFHLSDIEISPKIIIENDGLQSLTQDEGLHIFSLVDEIIPRLYPVSPFGFSVIAKADSDIIEYQSSGELYIDGNYADFETVKYVAYVDEIKVSETEIELTMFANGNPILPEYKTFELTQGQTLKTYIVAWDNLGLTHEYPIDHYVAGSNEKREYYYDVVKITSQDGRVIFDNTPTKKEKYEVTYS
ncbi:MAG: hypothetical protein R3Y09_13795 [Clostridia bacterium]